MGAGVAVHLPVNLHGFSVREEDRYNYSTRRELKRGKKDGHAVVGMERQERKMLDDLIKKHAEEEGVVQFYSAHICEIIQNG